MTAEKNNAVPVPDSEKPGLGLAMELAQFVKDEMQKLDRSVKEQVGAALQANAQTVKRIEGLEGSVRDLKTGLEARAVERVEKDYQEAEARYILARQQRDKLSTQEKIEVNQLLENRDAARKKARADWWRAQWDKITPNILSAMILAVLIPVWLAFVIVILAFVLRALGIAVQLPTP